MLDLPSCKEILGSNSQFIQLCYLFIIVRDSRYLQILEYFLSILSIAICSSMLGRFYALFLDFIVIY